MKLAIREVVKDVEYAVIDLDTGDIIKNDTLEYCIEYMDNNCECCKD